MAITVEEIFLKIKRKEKSLVEDALSKVKNQSLLAWEKDEEMKDLVEHDYQDSIAVIEEIYQNEDVSSAIKLYRSLDTSVRETIIVILKEFLELDITTERYNIFNDGNEIGIHDKEINETLFVDKNDLDQLISALIEAKNNYVR